jgi:hypothetical protein
MEEKKRASGCLLLSGIPLSYEDNGKFVLGLALGGARRLIREGEREKNSN